MVIDMALIDTDEFLEEWMKYDTDFIFDFPLSIVREIIASTSPVDAEPVVRCKYCKHRESKDCPMYHESEYSHDDDGWFDVYYIETDNTEDDGFCHMGSTIEDD